MKKKYFQKGFTLIELLVVISIIGILASIVLVSLDSARKKARNSKSNLTIREYRTAFEMALDQNKEFPDPGNTNWYCLGNYGDDRCWRNGTSYSENGVINNILDDWIPLPADERLICGYNNNPANCYEGYIYRCATRTNNICSRVEVRWFLEGSSQPCGIGTRIGNYNTATYCRYFSS